MLKNKRNIGVFAPIIRDFETQPKRIAYSLVRGKVVKCWLVGLEANYAIEDNMVLVGKFLPSIMNLLMDTFKEQRKEEEWILEFAEALNKAFKTDVKPILDKRVELDQARAQVEAKEREILELKASLESKEEVEDEDETEDENKYGVTVDDLGNFSEDELIAQGAEMNLDVNKILGPDDDFTLLKATITEELTKEAASTGLTVGKDGVVTVNDKSIEIKPFDPSNATKDQLLEYGYLNQVEGISHKLNVADLKHMIEAHLQTKQ